MQLLPIRDTVERSYAVFFKAPLAFLTFAMVPLAVFAILLIFVDLSLDRISDDLNAWRPFLLASSSGSYAILIFWIGVVTAGAAHIVRGNGFPVGQTISATFRRLPTMLLASFHIALTLGNLFYGITVPFAGPAPFGLFLMFAIVDTTVLAFVLVASRVEGRGPISSFVRSV